MMLKMLSINFSIVLNIGLLLLTLVESYVFPFAIVKWMIVVTKCGGVLSLIKRCSVPKTRHLRTRYKYSLQLVTSRETCQENVLKHRVSHLNVIVEDEYNTPGMCKRIQVRF